MTNNSSLQQKISVLEKKRTCNIGPKSKRLHIDNEDAMELNLTWEETQDLLRPSPSVKPSVVTIEDQVSEEYDNLALDLNYSPQEQWGRNNGLNVMIALNGESCLLMLFFLPTRHVLKMFGIEVFMFCTRVAKFKGIRKSSENKQRCDPDIYV
ncbi:B3 domain-containing transcription repressor VAL2 [Spatholobus suberectus]|nr:B3 domain-containing transcription repressor VAL2 [Spatholobus suberectus]